jgi:hypothetical protein
LAAVRAVTSTASSSLRRKSIISVNLISKMLICIILLVLMSVFGVVANLSVIVCIISNASIRKGRNYLLIFSMTIADCLFLLIVSTQDLLKKSTKQSDSLLISENLTDNVVESIEISSGGGFRATRNILFRLFHFTAVGSLVALNADKFYYIYAPFRYERCVTRKRLCALIALIWTFSFAWTLFEHFRYCCFPNFSILLRR